MRLSDLVDAAAIDGEEALLTYLIPERAPELEQYTKSRSNAYELNRIILSSPDDRLIRRIFSLDASPEKDKKCSYLHLLRSAVFRARWDISLFLISNIEYPLHLLADCFDIDRKKEDFRYYHNDAYLDVIRHMIEQQKRTDRSVSLPWETYDFMTNYGRYCVYNSHNDADLFINLKAFDRPYAITFVINMTKGGAEEKTIEYLEWKQSSAAGFSVDNNDYQIITEQLGRMSTTAKFKVTKILEKSIESLSPELAEHAREQMHEAKLEWNNIAADAPGRRDVFERLHEIWWTTMRGHNLPDITGDDVVAGTKALFAVGLDRDYTSDIAEIMTARFAHLLSKAQEEDLRRLRW